MPAVSSTRPSKLVPGIGSDTEPGREHDVLGLDVVAVHRDLALARQRRRPLEHVDLVLLHQAGDAAR